MLLLWYLARYGDSPSGFFHYDDFWLLGDAARAQTPADVFLPGTNRFVLYRPLSQVGYFWALKQLFGYDPAPYHVVQLLAHVLNAWLVYAVAGRIFASPPLGLAAALIYAAEPGHAIAVYWNALFSMTGIVPWYLGSLWWWLRDRDVGGAIRWKTTAVALVLFVAALLAGEHAVSLPLALFLASTLILEESWKRALLRLAPLLLLAAVYAGAKILYMRFGLEADFGDPMRAALTRLHYSPAFAPLESLRLLGFYAGCAIGWLYDSSPAAGRWYGVAVIMVLASIASAWQARTSARARQVLFGLLFFACALGPVLLLPGHAYSYYVGTAGAGIAIALVAATHALPRFGGPAVAALVVLVLAGEVLVAEPRVRANADFSFLRDFRLGALRWITAVDAAAAGQGAGFEVVVPRNGITNTVFANGRAHQLLLGATYRVTLVENIEVEAPREGRAVLKQVPLWQRGTEYPGRAPRWDWLRRGIS